MNQHEEPLTSANITAEFVRAFPDWAAEWNDELDFLRDEEGDNVFCTANNVLGSLILLPLVTKTDRDTDDDLLLVRGFAFVERMLSSDDSTIVAAADTGILEQLDDHDDIVSVVRLMPPTTRDTILRWRGMNAN